MRFVDTNILLYAATGAPESAAKARVADALLREADLGLSVQVLQEFYVQATRVSRAGRLREEDALALLRAWSRFPVQALTLAIFHAALASARRFRISYWDASIIEAARALGCDTVLSEDLQDGQNFAGVRVVNPFRAR